MSRTRYKIFETHQPYFMTMTVVDWLPLFSQPNFAEIFISSLRFIHTERRVTFYAYVLLENHSHMIAYAEELPKVMKEFKSYTARKIIDQLEASGPAALLSELHVRKSSHKKESIYQVWQEGSHPQMISSEEMMAQKIDYIHYNPVRRGYVYEPSHWRYSSAGDYEGKKGLVEVATDWMLPEESRA
jgi:REP element-mobilizing transposase RayT